MFDRRCLAIVRSPTTPFDAALSCKRSDSILCIKSFWVILSMRKVLHALKAFAVRTRSTYLLKKSVRMIVLPSISLISTASTVAELLLFTNRINSPFVWCTRLWYMNTTLDVFILPSRGRNAKQVVVIYKLPGIPMHALRPVPPWVLSCSIET